MSPRTRRAVGIALFALLLSLLLDRTPVGQNLEEVAYDQRMAVWRSVVQPHHRDDRLRLVVKNDSTSMEDWSDERTLQFIEDVLEAGAEGVILFDVESLFSDWPSVARKLPARALPISSAEDPGRQLHHFHNTLDRRDILRSFKESSVQLEFTETLARLLDPERSGQLQEDLFVAFLVGRKGLQVLQHRFGIIHQEGYLWRELGALAKEFSGPDPPDYRGTLVFLEPRSRAADRFEVRTPVGFLSPAEVYISAVNSLLTGDRFVEPPGLLQILVFGAVLLGVSVLSAGLRPWQLFVLGVLTLFGMYAATLTLFQFGLTMPVIPLLLGSLLVFLFRALMDFRRATSLLQSFGGAEDSKLTGEEANATIFFTELPRYLLDLEKENSPDLLKRRRQYNALLEEITVKYRGRVLDFQGDAQMVGFGLRIADDLDHPLEATAAALEFVEACRGLAESWGVEPTALEVHAGVCSGPVALGHVGAESKQDIAAIGDTTNTAARLMGAAMKLQLPVVVAETTYQMANGRIQGEPLPPVELKGKSAPVAVYRALAVDPQWLAQSASLEHEAVPAGGTIEYQVTSQKLELAVTSLLIIGSLLLGVYFRGLVTSNRLEIATYDLLTRTLAQRAADPSIVLVGVDQESARPEHLGPYPWRRSVYAQAIENLRDSGYRGIFFDILLRTDRADDPEGDRALVRAVKSEPRAVLAASLVESSSEAEVSGLVTSARFLSGLDLQGMLERHQAGLIHRLSDQDGAVRSALAAYPAEGLLYPTGALALLMSPGETFQATEDGLQAGERPIPSSVDPAYPHELAIRFGPARTADPPSTEDGQYRYVSFHRLLDPQDPIFRDLEGAYLLVGDTFSEGERKDLDRIDTPVGRLKGVEVHARTLDTILNEDFLWTTPRHNGWDTLMALVVALLGAGVLLRYRQVSAIVPRLVLLVVGYAFSIVVLFKLFDVWIRPVFPLVLLSFVIGAVLVARYLLAVNALARFIPTKVVEELMYEDQAKDRRQIATVLLTDIRGYTTLSEGRSAVGMLDLLNEYHSRTVACYERHGGQVLTYQGDAQIVVFGVFGDRPNPAGDAVAAALDLQSICDQLRTEWGIASKDDFDVGAGLCTGEVEVGFLGGTMNRQYSVVGETVRKSHKVQSMSDELQAPVLLDEETKTACGQTVEADDLGLVQPKGLPHPIRLYRARAVRTEAPAPQQDLD